jgi:hypothetical protein
MGDVGMFLDTFFKQLEPFQTKIIVGFAGMIII